MAWSRTRTGSPRKTLYREFLQDFASDEHAATSIEYAMIAAILTGCLVVALPLVSFQLAESFTLVADSFAAILGD